MENNQRAYLTKPSNFCRFDLNAGMLESVPYLEPMSGQNINSLVSKVFQQELNREPINPFLSAIYRMRHALKLNSHTNLFQIEWIKLFFNGSIAVIGTIFKKIYFHSYNFYLFVWKFQGQRLLLAEFFSEFLSINIWEKDGRLFIFKDNSLFTVDLDFGGKVLFEELGQDRELGLRPDLLFRHKAAVVYRQSNRAIAVYQVFWKSLEAGKKSKQEFLLFENCSRIDFSKDESIFLSEISISMRSFFSEPSLFQVWQTKPLSKLADIYSDNYLWIFGSAFLTNKIAILRYRNDRWLLFDFERFQILGKIKMEAHYRTLFFNDHLIFYNSEFDCEAFRFFNLKRFIR